MASSGRSGIFYSGDISPRKKIVWITDSTTMGRGDYDYLQALSRPDYLEKMGLQADQYEHVRIVCVSDQNDTLVKVDEKTKQKAVKIDADKEDVRVVLHNPLDGNDKQNQLNQLYSTLNHVYCFIAVSAVSACAQFNFYNNVRGKLGLTKAEKSFFIGAHGTSSLKIATNAGAVAYQIGMRDGFLMDDLVSPFDADARVKSLAMVEQPYLRDLLNHTGVITEKETRQFLANTLFVPAYLQHTEMVAGLMNGVAMSAVAAQYPKGVTFHFGLNLAAQKNKMNTPDAFIKCIHDETKKHLQANGYGSIQVDGFQGKEGVTLSLTKEDAHETGRTLRIIAHRWMENKLDFERLFGAAQVIAGVSGDNSLNNALAKGVVPFYVVQPWNVIFGDEFSAFLVNQLAYLVSDSLREPILAALQSEDKKLTSLTPRFYPEIASMQVATNLAKLLNQPEAITHLQSVVAHIQQKNNFDDMMKQIASSLSEFSSKKLKL